MMSNPPTQQYVMRGAQRIGVDHKRAGTNCQDAFAMKRVNDDLLVAAVADGCGSAAHSETGALRAVSFLVRTAALYMQMVRGDRLHIDSVCPSLWQAYQLHLFRQVLAQFADHGTNAEARAFIETHLLHTIHVLIVDDGYAWSIHRGDGYLVQDDLPIGLIDSIDNNPDNGVLYPAFALDYYLGEHRYAALQNGFVCERLGHDWDRLAIATDGLREIPHQHLLSTIYTREDDTDANVAQINLDLLAEDGYLTNHDDVTFVSVEKVPYG